MQTVFAILMLLSSVAFAEEKELEVFVGGKYTCDFSRKREFLKTRGPFELEISQDGAKSSTRILKLANKKYSLEAKNYNGIDFKEIHSDFPTVNNMPIAYIDTLGENNGDGSELSVGIAFETEPHTYQADALKCTGEAVMKKVPILQFDCDTKDLVGQKEIPVKLRFALANLADPQRVMVLNYEGEETQDYTPIQVDPDTSYFTSLNENLRASVRRDYVLIEGDSDGVYYSYLRLNRPDLTQGVAWLEGDDEISPARRQVSCTVIGDVKNAFEERNW